VESEKHRKAGDWLKKSGYGLEMQVAEECRKHWLPTTQSVPYVDPIQQNTIREADVVVRFGSQLSISADCWSLAAVIECKSPTGKPWAALMALDKVSGLGSSLERSISAAQESWGRLIYAWGGFVPFGEASSAEALISVHEDQKSDHNTAASALRQAMSAASGIDQQFDPATQERDFQTGGDLVFSLPVLVTAGELYGATLDTTGEVQVEDLTHVFVKTPRPGDRSVGYVHVMTFDFFAESFAPDLGKMRRAQVF
jgi:hypothetical protein